MRSVFESLVALGAPNDILYSHKPHIGTDLLRGIVKNARAELIARGCEVRFGHTLTDLNIRDGRLDSVTVSTGGADYELAAPALILAPGHSARDTFSMLHRAGVPIEAKPFAVGLRIEHGQEFISRAQYGQAWTSLPPSDYKLACHLPDGRGVFTFCVCPGGVVVAAASEPGRLTTNGMSERARGGGNCNGAVLVGVSPADFPDDTPLGGIAYQIALEEAAFTLGGGGFRAPAQMVGDFLRGVPSKGFVAIKPSYQPGVIPADLAQCLPPVVTNALREALPIFGRKLAGFDAPGAVLTGVESRSSSPVRLLRGADLSSPVAGLFPCGEGAGWAGGIVSAAVDGIRAAEAVAAPQA